MPFRTGPILQSDGVTEDDLLVILVYQKRFFLQFFFWLDICVGLNFLFGWDGESVGCVKEYPWIGALVRWT